MLASGSPDEAELLVVQPCEGQHARWQRLIRELELRWIRNYAKGAETCSSCVGRNGTDLCGRTDEVAAGQNLSAKFEYTEDKAGKGFTPDHCALGQPAQWPVSNAPRVAGCVWSRTTHDLAVTRIPCNTKRGDIESARVQGEPNPSLPRSHPPLPRMVAVCPSQMRMTPPS